ncbi:hypothetical protein BCR39DRAFT_587311 [Naematelia encephala]|uniref:Uncharacterized protein n=1 Tax=Naematelia encephala TaxID=71784 RepID=A0A1Y2BAA8_9TREE|nr:hypothetical protein BCR39DRAFT_587311 [Naematelia encephala]
MAAVRTMMAAAREEAAILSAEAVSTARAGVLENVGMAARMAEKEVGTIGVRQVAEVAVKDVSGESSLLSSRLTQLTSEATASLPLPNPNPNSILSESQTIMTSNIASTRSTIAKTLEKDLGVSIRDALSNSAQTGVEEQMDQVADIARAVNSGEMNLQAAVGAAA